MTLNEFLAIPNEMGIEEYNYIIRKKHKLEKQIVKYSNHLTKKKKAESKKKKVYRELRQLELRLK